MMYRCKEYQTTQPAGASCSQYTRTLIQPRKLYRQWEMVTDGAESKRASARPISMSFYHLNASPFEISGSNDYHCALIGEQPCTITVHQHHSDNTHTQAVGCSTYWLPDMRRCTTASLLLPQAADACTSAKKDTFDFPRTSTPVPLLSLVVS